MSSGSSDGRQGAASPHAPAASSSPLTAEDAERFASVLKPMWELDSASQPAAPLAPPSKPRVANPAVTVKARQPQPAPTSRDSSHEFDDLAQLPHGPSAAPDAMGVVAAPVTIPEPELEPEGASAVAVQPHLPPRRQQISEPRHSVEVDAPPPQTVPSAFLQTAPGHADSTGPAVAQPAYGGGPTVEQLRARAARGQPTMVINKREASFPGRRSRAPWVIGLGLLVLGGGAAAALFMTASRTAAAGATTSSSASSTAPSAVPAMTAAAASPSSPSTPASVAAASPAPPDPSGAVPPAHTGTTGANAPTTTATSAATASSATASAATTASANTGTTHAAPAPKYAPPKHKTPGTIVRSSPF